MATRKKSSIIGEYSGAIDSVVLSNWNDIGVMRSMPEKKRKKIKSKKPEYENVAFGMVSKFLSSAKSLIDRGYQKAKVVKKTPFNAAIAYHLKNAVIGGPEFPTLDLSKIKLSKPIRKTQSAWNPVLLSSADYKITVTWELNPFPQKCTQLDDNVILVCCDSTYNQFSCISFKVKRSELSYTRTLYKSAAGHVFHGYLFLISADGKLVSETEYLGKVTITA